MTGDTGDRAADTASAQLDTATPRDGDGDGHTAQATGGDDCDDTDAAIFPGAEERCANLRDDDCDGRTDEGCAPAGPPDPGGLSWICGFGGHASGAAVVFAAVLLFVGRRR